MKNYKDSFEVTKEEFYDNLKLSLSYEKQNDEFGIYADANTKFRNIIIRAFECLSEGKTFKIQGKPFLKIGDFNRWLFEENKELGIEKHKDFIERHYKEYLKK